MIDLTDGRTGFELATFFVTFIGVNNLPYYSPPLPGLIQIFKQTEQQLWTFPMPNIIEDDMADVVTLSVDLKDTIEFMSFLNDKFEI